MRLATVEQCSEIDELSQRVYALSGEVLQESAGSMAARELDQAYFPDLKKGKTAIVCGPGNNGADGLVTARHLHSTGYRDISVYLLAPAGHRSNLFLQQLNRAELQGLKIYNLEDDKSAWDQLAQSQLMVDALFGIGLSREVEGDFARLIELMNSNKAPTISLDTPSGLNGNTGVEMSVAVKADMTFTFGVAKPGFFVAEGPTQIGKLRVLPIGFPFECIRGVATSHFLFNERLAKRYLPQRKDASNKSNHGHLLVIAGSPKYWGAGVLACTAGYRMGSGYVTWASQQKPIEELKSIPEVVLVEYSSELLAEREWSAVAVGSGLGVNTETGKIMRDLIERGVKNVVVDADAITVCMEEKLFPLPESWVLTPHSGELSRLLKISSHEIDKDRFAAAHQGSEVAGCHVLLKGFRTVIAFRDRAMVVNAGNSALAKAGTGDVLTGMIGSLLAQGLETLQAAATGSYIHGRLADEWVRLG
ncbi:MAG: NAD(P)H-hydrate dehydratase, partial [Bdellovibrionales bacterium]|nr:NAD(P)H-hydrate dehydratase [Bdellovibrionales bacterium]